VKRALGASVAVYVWLLSRPIACAVEYGLQRLRDNGHAELVDGPAAAASIGLAIERDGWHG
jgi:hypothetical protein